MDTTLALPTAKAVSPVPYALEQRQDYADDKVPTTQALDGITVRPTDQAFVAQVVTARLSGTAFPENPSEIAPPERTLKPYNVPMLPYDKEEPVVETSEEAEEVVAKEARQQLDDSKPPEAEWPELIIPQAAKPAPEVADAPKPGPVESKPAEPALTTADNRPLERTDTS